MDHRIVETRQIGAGSRLNLPVIITAGDDGWLVGMCPVLPGCISQGRTEAELLDNMIETAELTLSCREAEGWQWPTEYRLAHVEVSA